MRDNGENENVTGKKEDKPSTKTKRIENQTRGN